jgi:hypothetical protein
MVAYNDLRHQGDNRSAGRLGLGGVGVDIMALQFKGTDTFCHGCARLQFNNANIVEFLWKFRQLIHCRGINRTQGNQRLAIARM